MVSRFKEIKELESRHAALVVRVSGLGERLGELERRCARTEAMIGEVTAIINKVFETKAEVERMVRA